MTWHPADDNLPRGRAAAVLWLAGLAGLCTGALYSRGQAGFADDSLPFFRATVSLRQLGDPYGAAEGLPFVYPPSAALLGLPLSWLSQTFAADVGMLVCVVAAVVLACASAVAAGAGRVGTVAAGVVIVLAGSNLGYGTIQLGNMSLPVAAAAAVAVVLASTGRWRSAAVVLGLAMAVKPLVAPSLLVFIVLRRQREAAVCLAIPVCINLVTVPLLTDPLRFARETLPVLLAGQALPRDRNLAVSSVLEDAPVPSLVVLLVRAALLLLAVSVCLHAVEARPEALRVSALVAVPVLAVALVGGVDESHFSLVAVPMLVAIMMDRTLVAGALAGLALLLAAVPQAPALQAGGQVLALLAALVAACPRCSQWDRRTSVRLVSAALPTWPQLAKVLAPAPYEVRSTGAAQR